MKEVEIKEEAAELEALKILCSGNDEEIKQYRAAIRRKRLNKFLEPLLVSLVSLLRR